MAIVKLKLDVEDTISVLLFLSEVGDLCGKVAGDSEAPPTIRLAMLERLESVVTVVRQMNSTMKVEEKGFPFVTHKFTLEGYTALVDLVNEVDASREAAKAEMGIEFPDVVLGGVDKVKRQDLLTKFKSAEKVE